MADFLSKTIEELTSPALVIYKHVLLKNVQHMNERASKYGVKLRPHFKTTKCLEAAIIQTNGSKRCMVVSTIPEAELLYRNGFDDILFGIPFPSSKIDKCVSLSEKMEHFSICVDREDSIQILDQRKLSDAKKWSVFVMVDCDNRREGIWHGSKAVIQLVSKIKSSSCISFKGLYAHCGNSYGGDNLNHVHKVATSTCEKLLNVVNNLEEIGISCPVYGIGSTPTCSNPSPIMNKLTEWHPGNYVLYDVMQMRFGSCTSEEIASFVITRIIGHYPQSNHLIVDCGFTALSLHGGGNCYGKTPGSGFGIIAGHPELKLDSMSQEHGIVRMKEESACINFSLYPVGMMLRIYPDHACATCAMHRVYFVANENDIIIDQWYPVSGW